MLHIRNKGALYKIENGGCAVMCAGFMNNKLFEDGVTTKQTEESQRATGIQGGDFMQIWEQRIHDRLESVLQMQFGNQMG
jgi:hypothetical protein